MATATKRMKIGGMEPCKPPFIKYISERNNKDINIKGLNLFL